MQTSKKCSSIDVFSVNSFINNSIKYMSGKGKLVGWLVVLTMWTGCGVGLSWMKTQEQNKVVNTSEIVNTAEDMIEWIVEDVANGYLDNTYADTYIDNLEQIIKEIK